ncbi:MAG: GNAT family N-acetyltransferase [Caldisphaera sp.]|jgi:ribosomal protein S18 acetylase RimI-like enzyme|nr:MAG: hypothetical protein C0171_07040 [Caldisphaera sp.]
MLEKIFVERINKEDKKEIEDLTRNTWEWGDYITEVFDSWLNDGLFLKAIDENRKILGIIHVRIFEDFAWLEGIRIKSDIRRRGLGKFLTLKAMEKSIANIFRLIVNENNYSSIRLVTSLGFREIDKIYYIHKEKKVKVNEIIKDYGLKEVNQKLDIKGYINNWVWFPISKYKGKIYSNDNMTLLDTDPPFAIKGILDNASFSTNNFIENSESFLVFELKLKSNEIFNILHDFI